MNNTSPLKMLTVRMTDSQYRAIRIAAARHNVSMNTFALKLLASAAEIDPDASTLPLKTMEAVR